MRNPILIVLFMNTVFSSVLAFSNLYLNIFLWNQGGSLPIIGVYNTLVFTFLFVGTILGSYTMRWVNSRLTFILSSLFLVAVFGLLINKEAAVMQYIILMGVLYGTALGLYYSGFNLYSILLTKPENRQLFMGMEQIMNRITSILTPLIFSYLILFYDYTETFRLIFVMLIIQVIISFFTPMYKSNFNISSLRYKDIWREYRSVLISIISFGFFQSIIQLASSILLFQYVQKETIVGWFNTFFSIVGIGTLILISRPRLVKNRMKVAYVGAILATIMTVLLFVPNVVTLIIFNVLAAIALPLIWIPVSVVHYTKIKELACESEMNCDIGLTAHYLLIREFMLSAGRTVFYFLLIIGLDFTKGYHYLPIFLFSLIIPLTIYICNKELIRELGTVNNFV